MGMLEISIGDGKKARRVVNFDRSPIRLGRGPANDVIVDAPWVSGEHGLISFENDRIFYRDLNSRNGTWIDSENGRRVAPQGQTAPLAEGEWICLGVSESDPARDVVLKLSLIRGSRGVDAPPPPSSPGLRTAIMQDDQAAQFVAIANQRALPQGPTPVSLLPTPPTGPQVFGHIPARTPPVGSVDNFNHANAQAARSVNENSILRSLLPAGTNDADQVRVMIGLTIICQTLAQGFIELRRSHEAFAREVGVRPVGGHTRIGEMKTASDLVRFLVGDGTPRLDHIAEVTQLFNDLALHDVALLSGIREGVKSLLAKMDPGGDFKEAETERGGRRLFENRFERYVDFYKEQTEDDGHSVIFGSEFAAAYGNVKGPKK